MRFFAEVSLSVVISAAGGLAQVEREADDLTRRLGGESWDATELRSLQRAYDAAGVSVETSGLHQGTVDYLSIEVPVEAADAATARAYLAARLDTLPPHWSFVSTTTSIEPMDRPPTRVVSERVWVNPAIPSIDDRDIEQGSHGVVEAVDQVGLRRPRYLVRFEGHERNPMRGWVTDGEFYTSVDQDAPAT